MKKKFIDMFFYLSIDDHSNFIQFHYRLIVHQFFLIHPFKFSINPKWHVGCGVVLFMVGIYTINVRMGTIINGVFLVWSWPCLVQRLAREEKSRSSVTFFFWIVYHFEENYNMHPWIFRSDSSIILYWN
jgi:hypothetical protein